MGYYLQNPANASIILPMTGGSGLQSLPLDIEIVWARVSNTGATFLLGITSGWYNYIRYNHATQEVQVRYTNGGVTYSLAVPTQLDTFHKLRLVKTVTGAPLSVYLDDVYIGDIASGWFSLVFNRMGNVGGSTSALKVKTLKVIGSGNNLFYDANLSNGSGSVWPSANGGSNATFDNYPANNSYWISYEDTPTSSSGMAVKYHDGQAFIPGVFKCYQNGQWVVAEARLL